jgi:hypothetical protein
MAAVDLPVDDELLPYFDASHSAIGGRELGRRHDHYNPGVTLITLDMDEAPAEARTMEVVLERVLHEGSRILSITYCDADGRQLLTTERPGDSGRINEP